MRCALSLYIAKVHALCIIAQHHATTHHHTGSHVLDEAERSLHDALCVLVSTVKDSRVLYGGGWPEMQMAKARGRSVCWGLHVLVHVLCAFVDVFNVVLDYMLSCLFLYDTMHKYKQLQVVDELAAKTPGKRSLAMQSFAKALRAIPTIISDNAGLDAAELLSQLRAAHAADDSTRMGVDVLHGKMGDMKDLGIFEAFKVCGGSWWCWQAQTYTHTLHTCST